MEYRIREIEERDNKAVEQIVRYCLKEFGADHEGCAWTDPYLGRFSQVYSTRGNRYWVAEDTQGKIVGGVGVGSFEEAPEICELQKMYCLPEARGTGIAHLLLQTALTYAKDYYRQCYLETFGNMIAAQKFYDKHGFYRIQNPLVDTGHYTCDVFYLKDL
ncbi:MAG: GNAT family N-acetyltransferase [Lachnospiraceae bacterium]|nr:GNAT family N-acetyltransferase [Lachnospiraceae bacterium]